MSASPALLGPLVVVVALTVFTWLELRFPLRQPIAPKLQRVVVNLTTGGLAALVGTGLQLALLAPLAFWLAEHQVGLLRLVELPSMLEVPLAVVLLDLTLWHWHFLNHRVPLFWRFHLVHHTDADMDASTALRFHFGELGLSAGYRALQLLVIGASPVAVVLWSTLLSAAVLFHHANLRLPWRIERWLVRLIVTPRMHALHHSVERLDRDSNYSSLLSIWDRLHRTWRPPSAEAGPRIGVPGYLGAEDASFGRLQALPFERPRRGV